ncbi:MAG TPA: alcohol dehydrogenase catalytic domain-containing protein, partial [Deinococcales bacterium]|nr:alcohol dehydrogenase catalytic domain-containing protein [Deinococcales bacterium]
MTATTGTQATATAGSFRAIVANRYGPPEVLELVELPMPETLGEHAVLVRVKATSVNPVDSATLSAHPIVRLLSRSWRKPKVNRVGTDLAGVVEAVGSGVTRFRPGDEVFGACRGALGEYVRAREAALVAQGLQGSEAGD